MKMNSKTWDVILKAIIAVASAVLGALGVQAMNL
nr:smalltalk protein [Bacteroides sp. 224]